MLIGFIFMVMRSPIAMLLVGITSGVFFYHYYPNKAQEGIYFVQNGYSLMLDEVYSTPVVDLTPEDRSVSATEYQGRVQSEVQGDEYQTGNQVEYQGEYQEKRLLQPFN